MYICMWLLEVPDGICRVRPGTRSRSTTSWWPIEPGTLTLTLTPPGSYIYNNNDNE